MTVPVAIFIAQLMFIFFVIGFLVYIVFKEEQRHRKDCEEQQYVTPFIL
jgi:hypothetical protein